MSNHPKYTSDIPKAKVNEKTIQGLFPVRDGDGHYWFLLARILLSKTLKTR